MRTELRQECCSVRCARRHTPRFSMTQLQSSTERGTAGRAGSDLRRISLEFAALDTRLNDRLSGWICSFVWAPTGRSRLVRRLYSNVV